MPKPKPSRPRPAAQANTSTSAAFSRAVEDLRHSSSAFPNISGRWILGALAILLAAGLACAWATLCLLYWQGSWQLLYHPKAAITKTPAAIDLPFEAVKFAATETGTTRLTGWWVPAENAHFTVLYLHGAEGNLSDTLDALAALHKQSLNVFAIDYRGYGQSQPSRPTEKQLRQDAEWALTWLIVTRLLPAKNVIVAGTGLGANLAAELAADHSELAGVFLDQPIQNASAPIFNDPRSRLVLAHWIVEDHYDLTGASNKLEVPSLWFFPAAPAKSYADGGDASRDAFQADQKPKMAAWLKQPSTEDSHFSESLQRWLDTLAAKDR